MKKWIEIHYIPVLIIVASIIFIVRVVLSPILSYSSVVSFELTEGLTRNELTVVVGDVFAWSASKQEEFIIAYAGIQWDAFNQLLANSMAEEFGWGALEQQEFLSRSALFTYPEYDILAGVYIAGIYEFPQDTTPVAVAAELVERVTKNQSDPTVIIRTSTDSAVRMRVAHMINQKLELLPDLMPYPPQSLALLRRNGQTLLVFDTTYYNRGQGDLELIADPATAGRYEDIERTVYQRINHLNGSVRERPAGMFLWHEEHLHYHFSDFIEYKLEADGDTSAIMQNTIRQKSTFCIRDVSRISSKDETATSATYLVCGREKQGVSVGWGDTYFYTYPDQNIDITDLPSGRYQLSFIVNPDERFDEITLDNNTSSVIIDINKETGDVDVVKSYPEIVPDLKHIHIEQEF